MGSANATTGETLALIATRYIRLAAIDFAIRAAAFDVLAMVAAPPPALDDGGPLPPWARTHDVRSLLRTLPRSRSASRAHRCRLVTASTTSSMVAIGLCALAIFTLSQVRLNRAIGGAVIALRHYWVSATLPFIAAGVALSTKLNHTVTWRGRRYSLDDAGRLRLS